MAWLRHLYEQCRHGAGANAAALPDFDTFWRKGFLEIPAASEEYVLFGEFRADPEKHKLRTPSGKIELYSEKIAGFGYDDCPPHPTWIEPWEWLGDAAASAIRCIWCRASRATGCTARWIAARSAPAARSRAARRSRINPADAKARGIGDGDVVRVHNARGACLAGAIVTDAVWAGVVRLSCGAWYDPAETASSRLPARQSERADARPGHLEARAGAQFGDRAGRGRALGRAAQAGRRL